MIQQIFYRFMLTNTEAPHMGTINSNIHNPVYLSNYFYLNSDMNVSLDNSPYQSGYLTLQTFNLTK